MTIDQQERRTNPLKALIRRDPDKAAKSILVEAIAANIIAEQGDYYVMVESGAKFKTTTWDSKISRLRAEVRTEPEEDLHA
jgi:hypothetical protein